MIRPFCLGLILAATLAGTRADPNPAPRSAENEVSWTDTFEGPDLKAYKTKGTPIRGKNRGVELPSRAEIIRTLPMGLDAEAEIDLEFITVKQSGGFVILRRGPAIRDMTVAAFAVQNGKPQLVLLEEPIKPLDLPGEVKPGEVWTLKLRMHYGVAQAKAWPKGKPEPKEWQITRYGGDSTWEPRSVIVAGIWIGDPIRVTRLHARGTKPATDFFMGDYTEGSAKEKAFLTAQYVAVLRKEGKIRDALDLARDTLDAGKRAYGENHAFMAIALQNLAAMLHDAGKYDESLKTFAQAVTLAKKAYPTDHPQLALAIEGEAAALAAKAEWDAAEKKYRDVLAFRRRVLGDDHPDTAVAWNNLGQPLSLKAEHDEALKCFKESLRIRKGIYGDNHPATAKAMNNLAYQLFVMGELLAAKPYYEDALKAYTAAYGPRNPNHPDFGMVENNLGFLLKDMGRLKEAKTHFNRAFDIYTKAGGARHPLRATVQMNLALLAIENGDYVTARALLIECIESRKIEPGPNHPDTIAAEFQLALVMFALGEIDYTKQLKESFRKLAAKLPADHPAIALAIHATAVLMIEDEDKKSIRELLNNALKIQRDRLGPTHPQTLNSVNSLAHHYGLCGEHKKAEALLAETLPLCRDKLGNDHPLTCLVRHNLGGAMLDQKKFADAEGHLQQSVAGYRKVYGREHPDTARSLNLLAVTLAARGKRAEALTAAAEAASGYGVVARKLLAGTPERQHADIINAWRPEVRLYFSIAATDPDKLAGHGPALFRTALDWKATSGRALLDRLEAHTVGRVPEAAEKYRELQVHRRSLVQAVMRGAGPEGVEKYNEKLDELRLRIDTLDRALAKQVKGYEAIARVREAGPAEVAKRIGSGGILIEFVYLEAIRSGAPLPAGVTPEASYVALVVIPKGEGEPEVKLVPLGDAGAVEQVITKWLEQVKKRKRDPKIENAVHEKVWAPLAKAIPANTKRLYIAPAGQLAMIPFETIWDNNQFLIERYLISYCSTGRDLIPRPAPPSQPGQSVVVADPDFDHTGIPADAPPILVAPPSGVSALAFASDPPNEDRLQGFATEADAVAKLLDAQLPKEWKSYRRVAANEENVQTIHRPRVLYFITHGNFLRDQRTLIALERRPLTPSEVPKQGETALVGHTLGEDPRLRSYLCLTGFNHWKARALRGLSDGLLTAREVESLDLWGTDLVVTAACKTGVGDVQIGEGVMGLRRAFLQAGARTVVTSLWSVSDGKTVALMPRFMEYYLKGTPKAEALRRAQLDMIAELRRAEPDTEKEYQAAPFAWGAFICHGLPE